MSSLSEIPHLFYLSGVVVGFEPSVVTVFESEGSTLICIAVDSMLSCPIEFSFNFTLLVDGRKSKQCSQAYNDYSPNPH